MQNGKLSIDPAFIVAPVNRRVFGSFVEHMGRVRLRRHLRAGSPHVGRQRASGATSWSWSASSA